MPKQKPKATLRDLYRSGSQCVVAFISKMAQAPAGQAPVFPGIVGTGFLVNSKGLAVTNRHVVQVLEAMPPHPTSGKTTAGAFLLLFDEHGRGCHAVFPEIIGFASIDTFTSSDEWYGPKVPDIGMVQLAVKETPFLRLNTDDFAIEAGMTVSTIGYPLGTLPLTLHEKVSQVSPFIRLGIVSSVYPCPVPNPHGFTIDIIQQGGSSGSPIFGPDNERVVGVMWGGVLEPQLVIDAPSGYVRMPTNISLAEPAHIIAGAIEAAANYKTVQMPEVPTLQELRDLHPASTSSSGLGWEIFQSK